MRLKIASRKSDLARWQAEVVGRALQTLPSKPQLEFQFKSSLGDQNLDLPLASMGSKGVFTEDFYQDLESGTCDMVVHSWKDLPVEERPNTQIAMTLERADMRDLLLIPEVAWQKTLQTGFLEILTSSPRRVYNLSACLHQLLPQQPQLSFVNVRGNVPTRLSKMHEQGRALILAKAGLDRLLSAEDQGFLAGGASLRELIRVCRFMVLPLSLNPPAPAQGALAVEILRQRQDLIAQFSTIHEASAFALVEEERAILKRYGGGCHQKIGVGRLQRAYGEILSLRGLTDSGEVLEQWSLENSTPWACAKSADEIFPIDPKANRWFDRESLDVSEKLKDYLQKGMALWVAREDAFPENVSLPASAIVWTAGLQTWKKLAARGIWVHGSSEGLGEGEDPRLQYLYGPLQWLKLTHSRSTWDQFAAGLAVYALKDRENSPDLRGKTHFFWMSSTAFQRARELFPTELREGWHGCGPGSTFEFLAEQKELKRSVKAFISLAQFLKQTLPCTNPEMV